MSLSQLMKSKRGKDEYIKTYQTVITTRHQGIQLVEEYDAWR